MKINLKRVAQISLPVILGAALAAAFAVMNAPPAESATSGRDRALEAIRSFGPMKVVATDRALNASGDTVSGTRVEQLLDTENFLARETMTNLVTGELLKERSIVGRESTTVNHGLDYVGRRVALEPLVSDLTLWGGYENLLVEGDPVELSDTGQGRRLTVKMKKGEVVVFLGDDDLPTCIETTVARGPADKAAARRITYDSIEKVGSISAADVKLDSLPANPIVVEEHVLLPVSDPKIREQVPFGQYSLGAGVLGYELAYAEYFQYSPRADHAPVGTHGLVLIYPLGGESGDRSNDIQLTCHPHKGDGAELDLARYMGRIGDGRHHLWRREVAGQKVDVLVKTHHVDPGRVISAYVVLSDCLLELRASLGTADFDRVLQSIQPLE